LRRLWQVLGQQFTPEAWGKISEEYVVAMLQCEACGFVFFDPSLAGNETFYQKLDHPDYFAPNRPEFSRTLQFAQRNGLRRVLDVGCGSGAFLDMARVAGLHTSGLELNRVAGEKASAKGHCVSYCLLHELDRDEIADKLDLITLFQVLEHVPDPVGLLQQALAVLRPGGFVSIAVPSRCGVGRLAPWDPSLWPPHHLSHWRIQDFKQLAGATGSRLVETGGDILLGAGIAHVWKLHNRLAPALGKKPHPGGERLPAWISFLYRKTGMKFFFPNWGCSIYAFLQKP
jgi:SAM-dependent methyltransferase